MIFRVIRKFFFSIPTMLVLIIGLISSIIIATLLERTYGGSAARVFIYNAWWFEYLWIWFSLTLFVNLFHFKLWQRKKWAVVLFPFAFSTILLGFIMTKHFAIEGYLSLREGDSTDKFLSSTSYLRVKVRSETASVKEEYPVNLSPLGKPWSRRLILEKNSLSIRINHYIPNLENPKTAEAVEVTVETGVCSQSLLLFAGKEIEDRPGVIQCDEVEVDLRFGARAFYLPFSLRLEDFRVERYKDSQAPSQFHSDVVIEDPERNIKKTYSIYMNHVLRYRGYRVYQQSFDRDEKGSVFLVSRDPGTPVAYAGFFLLIVTIALAFFHPKSRIRELESQIRESE
jgi:hypothetical protein